MSMILAFVALRPMTLGTCTLLGAGLGAGLGEPPEHALRTNKVKTIATTALVPLNNTLTLVTSLRGLLSSSLDGGSYAPRIAILNRSGLEGPSQSARSTQGFRPSPVTFAPLPVGQTNVDQQHVGLRTYATDVLPPLPFVWATFGGPAGRRLARFMAEAVQALQVPVP